MEEYIVSALRRLCGREISLFTQLKTRLHSIDIAEIERISNAILDNVEIFIISMMNSLSPSSRSYCNCPPTAKINTLPCNNKKCVGRNPKACSLDMRSFRWPAVIIASLRECNTVVAIHPQSLIPHFTTGTGSTTSC